MIHIAPSLLACDFAAMGAAVRAVDTAGADALHLDVMDGLFVPNISFGLPVIKALRAHTKLPFDVHLMIVDPERYLARFAEAGADWITVHYEATKDPIAALTAIRALSCRAGLSVKPGTPIEDIYPLLPYCDMVLIMTVEPGFGGQAMIPACLDKARALSAEIARQGLDIKIEADGGINEKTAAAVRAAGVDILVAGSSVFGASDMKAAMDVLRGE
ncbi:MAG: ribulose-phosphate 3-epimerase [Clostridia bacterium]|nr:ribulose-phosphate 3-epimerase [Clostridia bacterium]